MLTENSTVVGESLRGSFVLKNIIWTQQNASRHLFFLGWNIMGTCLTECRVFRNAHRDIRTATTWKL